MVMEQDSLFWLFFFNQSLYVKQFLSTLNRIYQDFDNVYDVTALKWRVI